MMDLFEKINGYKCGNLCQGHDGEAKMCHRLIVKIPFGRRACPFRQRARRKDRAARFNLFARHFGYAQRPTPSLISSISRIDFPFVLLYNTILIFIIMEIFYSMRMNGRILWQNF